MKKKDGLKIGCHISSAGGYVKMAQEAKALDATTFAFFTRNPRGGKAKTLDEDDVAAFLEYEFETLVAHAPYTMNPCSAKENVREFAYIAMAEDLERMEHTPGNYYNFHPGSHTGQGAEKGIRLISELLNTVIKPQQQTTVLLETMAGKGSEIGGTFEELAAIIEKVEIKEHMGVCLDTCHVYDGGYDIVENLDGVLEEFDKVVGLQYLKALHLNDSKNQIASHKDRHEKIGQGFLGLSTFEKVINHPVLRELPMILETPNEFEGYKKEIFLLRNLYV